MEVVAYSKSKIGKNLKSSRTNHIGKGGELGVFLSVLYTYFIRLTVINWNFRKIKVKILAFCAESAEVKIQCHDTDNVIQTDNI